MNNIWVIKTAHHMNNGIDLADARVEQVKLPLVSVGGEASVLASVRAI